MQIKGRTAGRRPAAGSPVPARSRPLKRNRGPERRAACQSAAKAETSLESHTMFPAPSLLIGLGNCRLLRATRVAKSGCQARRRRRFDSCRSILLRRPWRRAPPTWAGGHRAPPKAASGLTGAIARPSRCDGELRRCGPWPRPMTHRGSRRGPLVVIGRAASPSEYVRT